MINVKTVNSTELNSAEARLVSAMQALGDKTRFRMFKLMLQDRDMCVSEIAATLGLSVPAVSQHFRIFEYVGLVDKHRDGQKVCYELKHGSRLVQEFKEILKEGENA